MIFNERDWNEREEPDSEWSENMVFHVENVPTALFFCFNEPVPLYQVEDQLLNHDLLSHAITAYMTQFYSVKSIVKAVLSS